MAKCNQLTPLPLSRDYVGNEAVNEYVEHLQQILQWLPTVNPQQINMVSTSRDDCTSGSIVIISYDLMTRCHEQLAAANFRIIVVVTISSSNLLYTLCPKKTSTLLFFK